MKNWKEQQESKLSLLQKVRVNGKKSNKEEITEESKEEKRDYKSLYRITKKEKEKVEGINKKLTTDISELKKRRGTEESTIKELKAEKLLLLSEVEGLKEEISVMRSTLDNSENRVKELLNENSNLNLNNIGIKDEVKKLKKWKKNHTGNISSLLRKLSKIDIEYKELEEINIRKNKELKTVKANLAIEQEKVKRLKEVEITETLKALYDRMTFENVRLYNDVIGLHRKRRLILRNLLRKEKDLKASELVEETMLGFVEVHHDKTLFNDLNGNNYLVKYSTSIDLHDRVVLAKKYKGIDAVAILDVYKEEYYPDRDIEEVKDQGVIEEVIEVEAVEEVIYEQLGEAKVTIVTAENGVKYREHLRKHGLDAIWLDPFEKSTKHLRTKAIASDIVLICTDAIPHSVKYMIEAIGKDTKYQLIGNHNEEVILARTRYVMSELGLLKEHAMSEE